MKCHDLKYQLSNLSGRLTDQEIQSLQEAVRIYDSNIKTGSKVLDVLLYEKQLICQKDGLPAATTKKNRNRHGFGTMSMKYVVKQYGGTLQTSIEGQIFMLKICIPIPKSAAK